MTILYYIYFMMKNETKNYKNVFLRFCQFIYLSVVNFDKNVLWESASACSFSFVFSFIPIVIIIVTVLTGLLNGSSEVLNFVMQYADSVNELIDLKPFISSLMSVKSLSLFNIFLAIWIVWMSRKLFLSIIRAMSAIFHKTSEKKSALNAFLTLISELSVVVILIAVIIAAFIFNKFIELPIFDFLRNSFPKFFSRNYNFLIGGFTYLLLFVMTFLIYRYVSMIKPKRHICVFYALLSTGGTYVVSFFLNKFLNVTNYNIVYGTISTVVVLMLKVYTFFIVFLFCAQMIYVSHNFNIMLKGEIYLLPDYDNLSVASIIRRLLFINPSIIQSEKNTLYFNINDYVYSAGEKSDFVYYIVKGTVCEMSESNCKYYDQGNFFGEVGCVLNQKRTESVYAVSPCEVMVLSAADFKQLLDVYPEASRKTFSKVAHYVQFNG